MGNRNVWKSWPGNASLPVCQSPWIEEYDHRNGEALHPFLGRDGCFRVLGFLGISRMVNRSIPLQLQPYSNHIPTIFQAYSNHQRHPKLSPSTVPSVSDSPIAPIERSNRSNPPEMRRDALRRFRFICWIKSKSLELLICWSPIDDPLKFRGFLKPVGLDGKLKRKWFPHILPRLHLNLWWIEIPHMVTWNLFKVVPPQLCSLV